MIKGAYSTQRPCRKSSFSFIPIMNGLTQIKSHLKSNHITKQSLYTMEKSIEKSGNPIYCIKDCFLIKDREIISLL
ncbi:hypothetical protein DSECCO2_270900 [anaerobic digester metagenome]